MGGSKKQTVGYKYFLGQHLLLTTNSIAILAMKFQDKIAWEGQARGGQRITINKPELFGGESREGGVSGDIDFLDGAATQGVNDYLVGKINPLPAFRWMTSLVYRQFYIGNNYYVKPPVVKARDVQVSKAWMPDIGDIGSLFSISNSNIFVVLDDSTSMNSGQARLSRDAAAEFFRGMTDSNNVFIHRVQSPTTIVYQKQAASTGDYEEIATYLNGLPGTVSGPAFNIQDAATFIKSAVTLDNAENLPFFVFETLFKILANSQETQTDRRNIVINLSDGGITGSVPAALATLQGIKNLEIYSFQFGGDTLNPLMSEFTNQGSAALIPLTISAQAAAQIMRNAMSSWVDINPVHIVYDMLTATITRQNHNTDRIGNSFMWAAQRLFDEGFGMSIYWRSRRDLQKLKEIIENHVDGKIFFSRETGKWEIVLTRDTMGSFSNQAIYIAIDNSPSMTAERKNTAYQGVKKVLEELRGTPHTIRISLFGATEAFSIQRDNCTNADYDALSAWLDVSRASTSGTNYNSAIAAATSFFEASGMTYKKLIVITDGEPEPISSAEAARQTLRYISNLTSYAINIEVTNTEYTGLISNHNTGVVPVVNSGDSDGIAGYIMSVIKGILFDDSNVVEWKDDIALETPSNLTNQLTITYRKKEDGEERAITVHDHASIAMYNEISVETIDYQAIYDDRTAGEIAVRDLRARSSPKVSGSFVISSAPPGFGPGCIIRTHCPRLGIVNRVCRVLDVDRKSTTGREMTVKFIEDTFSLSHVPEFEFVQSPTSDSNPKVPTARFVGEMPYYLAVMDSGQTSVDNELANNPESGTLMVLASPYNEAQISVELATLQAGVWTNDGSFTYSRSVPILTDLTADPLDRNVTVGDINNLGEVEINDLLLINNEFIRIDAFDTNTNVMTITRGCLDSLPEFHASGSRIIVDVDNWFTDNRRYNDGESLSTRLIPTSIIGRHPFSSLEIIPVSFRGRAFAPYRPGNFMIDGVYPLTIYPTWSPGYVLSWAHRDRRFQTTNIPEGYTDGNIGPETGVVYDLEIVAFDILNNNIGVVHTYSGITANSFQFDDSDFIPDLPADADYCVATLYSVRDTIRSINGPSFSFKAVTGYIPGDEAFFVIDQTGSPLPGNAIDFEMEG